MLGSGLDDMLNTAVDVVHCWFGSEEDTRLRALTWWIWVRESVHRDVFYFFISLGYKGTCSAISSQKNRVCVTGISLLFTHSRKSSVSLCSYYLCLVTVL